MKRIVTSVGLVALGASSIGVVWGQDMTPAPARFWSLSASLRGFYDSNINTAPDSDKPAQVDSFGFTVSPSVGINWVKDQNVVKFSYTYTLLWFANKPAGSTSHTDQDHNIMFEFDHAFNERFSTRVTDSFVIGQEPDSIRAGAALTTIQRLPGNNERNYGTITLNGQFTPLFGMEVGYANAYYHYHDTGGTALAPSIAGTSDRIENTIHLDGRWNITPETVGILGYQFQQVGYTADEPIGLEGATVLMSNSRDNRSHYGYVGLDHNFLPNLAGSVRAGIRATDYYNDPNNASDVNPYAMLALTYTYSPASSPTEPGSSVRAGFTYDRATTDLVSPSTNSFVRDTDTATIFATWTHRILPKLYGNINGQFQNSSFVGGTIDGKSERYYLFGLNLAYHFNPYFLAEVGYNYDKVDSDVGRTFDRNRVYIGVTGTY